MYPNNLQTHSSLVERDWRERDVAAVSAHAKAGRTRVVCIVPVTSIFGRPALNPMGYHGTIPIVMLYCNRELFQHGMPGTSSKLYYMNLWATMCWPSDHPMRSLTHNLTA